MFHRKKQNVTEVKGGHWSCKVDICRLTLIPRSFTKNSRSYQMPTAPSLSLSWTILKTFAHFLKPSFIHFVWDALSICHLAADHSAGCFFVRWEKTDAFCSEKQSRKWSCIATEVESCWWSNKANEMEQSNFDVTKTVKTQLYLWILCFSFSNYTPFLFKYQATKINKNQS